MDFKQHVLYQMDYQHWANDALFNALDRLAPEARTSPQPLFAASLQASVENLGHFYRKWFARLREETTLDGAAHTDWRELKNSLRHDIRSMQRWLENQSAEHFDMRIRYFRSASREEGAMWARDVYTHIFTQASLERGRISAIARTLGAPLPDLSYYTYRGEMGEHLQHLRQAPAESRA